MRHTVFEARQVEFKLPTGATLAQSTGSDRVPEQGEGAACSPDVKGEAPTVGGGNN